MPYCVKQAGKGKWRVENSDTGKVHAFHTSLKKANSQVRLLRAIDHGWKPNRQRKNIFV